MAVIEVEELLEPISEDAPCGEDPEFDAAFGEMERAAEAKPEQQYGDTIIPAEEADWKSVKRNALDVLGRSKDLRAATNLARALLHTDGFAGFRDCLELIVGYLERYWESIHPQLDPDDDNDPTMRVNTLMSLRDGASTLSFIKRTPLVQAPALGNFSLRDILIARGESAAADGEKPEMSTVEAAFMATEPQAILDLRDSVRETANHARKIEALVTEQVGAANTVSLDALIETCRDIERIVTEQLQRRGVGDDDEESAESSDGDDPSAGDETTATARATSRPNGEINTREDVIRTLDRLCAYYERHEPSSPLPLLLKRAKRLASMSFLEIIRDLTPEGLTQAESIGGLQSEEVDSNNADSYQ
jgi:type VI secretion system protein ImpA